MTSPSSTSGSRIVGYEIIRKPTLSELPTGIEIDIKNARGSLGHDGYLYVVPYGIDPLELGLIANAGLFQLLPIDGHGIPDWDAVIDLPVTAEEAARQIQILQRSYYDLLTRLAPDVSANLDKAVTQGFKTRSAHPVLGLIRRATIETWSAQRSGSDPLNEAERDRLHTAVVQRTIALIDDLSPQWGRSPSQRTPAALRAVSSRRSKKKPRQ